MFSLIFDPSTLFLFHCRSQLTLPTAIVGVAITSFLTTSVFPLRIVDRSAAGSAFGARPLSTRFRLCTSPHLPPFPCRFYSSKKKKSNKMPPKKAQVQEKVLLGRPGNNLKSGIVCEQCPHPFFFLLSHSTVHFLIPHNLFKPTLSPFLSISSFFPFQPPAHHALIL